MSNNLYKISTDLLQLINTIEDNGGEVNPSEEASLQINREQLSEKVVAYDYIIKKMNADVQLANSEILRIKDYIAKKEKAIDTLKATLLQATLWFGEEQKNGVKKLECGTITLSTRKNPDSVEFNEVILSNKYVKWDFKISNLKVEDAEKLASTLDTLSLIFKEESKVSKTEIKEDLKKGEVPGAWFKEGDINLVIK